MNRKDNMGNNVGEGTIIRPRPGGRRFMNDNTSIQPVRRAPSPTQHFQPSQLITSGISNPNPIVGAGSVLLFTAGQLRSMTDHPDPNGLRNQINDEIGTFENTLRAKGVDTKIISTARYLLCTLLDEIVLRTPWGNSSGWSTQTLLSKFHNDSSGGEKFFQIYSQLKDDPTRNIDLLELVFTCLSMGFEGLYRIQERGAQNLQSLQDELYHIIHSVRGEFEHELSPNWKGVQAPQHKLTGSIPLMILAPVVFVILIFTYIGFSSSLSSVANPTSLQLSEISRNLPAMQKPAPISAPTYVAQPTKPQLNLPLLLTNEIRRGEVVLNEFGNKPVIIIPGSGLFASGSDRVSPEKAPLLWHIASLLNQVTGPIHVTGHTDSDPISGRLLLKFQSNWALSQKRSEAVAVIMKQKLNNPNRLIAEGMANTRRIVEKENSRADKAKNRRIEISITSTQIIESNRLTQRF